MKNLLLLTPFLLMGCGLGMNNGGGGSGYGLDAYSFMNTGSAGSYSCTDVPDTYTQGQYCATGEHPNLCDC